MIRPHVNVPFEDVEKYLHLFKREKLDLEIYFGTRIIDNIRKQDIFELKETLDYNPLLTLHAPFMDLSPGAVDSKVRDITVKRFFEIIEFGKILQPRVIVFHSGYYRWKYCNRVDIWLEESLKTWIEVNEKASDLGIKIAIENIFEEEPSNLKLLAEKMNSQNFGICFDTGHFNLFSKIKLSDWLSMIKPYVIELHLHDNKKSDDSHFAIGDGSFDFRTLFSELKGRDIIYTIEAHTEEGVKKSIKRLKSFLKTA